MRKVTENLNSKLVTVSITELLVQCFPITTITTTTKNPRPDGFSGKILLNIWNSLYHILLS